MDTVSLVSDTEGKLYFISNKNTFRPIKFWSDWFITICRDCFLIVGKHSVKDNKLVKFGELDVCPICKGKDLKREETDEQIWNNTKLGDNPLVGAKISFEKVNKTLDPIPETEKQLKEIKHKQLKAK